MSAATQAIAFLLCTPAIKSVTSVISPVVDGYWNNAPKMSWSSASAALPTITSKPNCSARVATTSIVCVCTSSAMKNAFALDLATRFARPIASAAAVDSSSNDALAKSRPVRSRVIVWKFNNDSKRPCAISGWYGVYAVYQPGFSSTLRKITCGT